MNRTLVIAISILLAFCAGIYFWTEWQKKEFDASLPKPPAVEEQQVTDDTAGGHWHGDEWHAEPHEEQAVVQDESTSDGDEQRAESESVTINPDAAGRSEHLTRSEIKELNQTLEREGFHPEKLSPRQLMYLSTVGINVNKLPPEQRRQFGMGQYEKELYAKLGIEPPPEGYRYSFKGLPSEGILNLDENGEPILVDEKTSLPIKQQSGGEK